MIARSHLLQLFLLLHDDVSSSSSSLPPPNAILIRMYHLHKLIQRTWTTSLVNCTQKVEYGTLSREIRETRHLISGTSYGSFSTARLKRFSLPPGIAK